MNEYIIGNVVTLETTFRNTNQVLVDPTVVYLVVNKDGEPTTFQYGIGSQITKSATGTYSAELYLNVVGGWDYYWYSSGTFIADNGQFIVRYSGV